MTRYTNQPAYIVATGTFMPGEPISNDEMEGVLGLVDGKPSRYRRRILQSNGIKQRHYAIDENGEPSHLTDELAANAIKNAVDSIGADQNSVEMLAVGTTMPDLLAPGIASMVHGKVGGMHADILSCAGICGAGAAAYKAAAMTVIAGQHDRVVSCGTERPSVLMRGYRFKTESVIERDAEDENIGESYQYFHADFLRWMLSDGAGAFVIDNKPNENSLSLEIEWIETASYANELETCMYMGTTNPSSPNTENTWLHQKDVSSLEEKGLLLLRQDTKVLAENMGKVVGGFAAELRDKGYFVDTEIDWLLPHISSYFFYEKMLGMYEELGLNIPEEKWFTNLKDKGNTGAASIYIILDELFHSGKLKDGQKILLMIPESGRFSATYSLLTVRMPK